MADDTRESARPGTDLKASADTAEPGPKPDKKYVDFAASANVFADKGLSKNTAGAHVQHRASIWEAAQTIHPADYSGQFFGKPCVRQGLLIGIAGGFVAGSLAFIARRPVLTSGNWAVGSAMFIAFTSHEICQSKLKIEKENMARVKAVMERKAEEKKAKIEQIKRRREEDRLAAEAASQAESRRWWKPW